ncbi:unnamed protein product [Urochloa humidicola]
MVVAPLAGEQKVDQVSFLPNGGPPPLALSNGERGLPLCLFLWRQAGKARRPPAQQQRRRAQAPVARRRGAAAPSPASTSADPQRSGAQPRRLDDGASATWWPLSDPSNLRRLPLRQVHPSFVPPSSLEARRRLASPPVAAETSRPTSSIFDCPCRYGVLVMCDGWR